MWLKRKRREKALRTMIDLLSRTKTRIDSSDEAWYAGLSPAEIGMDLSIAIDALESGSEFDHNHIKTHFAPTGTIQETAMDSGWHDEYMQISRRFDSIIEELNYRSRDAGKKPGELGRREILTPAPHTASHTDVTPPMQDGWRVQKWPLQRLKHCNTAVTSCHATLLLVSDHSGSELGSTVF